MRFSEYTMPQAGRVIHALNTAISFLRDIDNEGWDRSRRIILSVQCHRIKPTDFCKALAQLSQRPRERECPGLDEHFL
jgi:hypothetical protein